MGNGQPERRSCLQLQRRTPQTLKRTVALTSDENAPLALSCAPARISAPLLDPEPTPGQLTDTAHQQRWPAWIIVCAGVCGQQLGPMHMHWSAGSGLLLLTSAIQKQGSRECDAHRHDAMHVLVGTGGGRHQVDKLRTIWRQDWVGLACKQSTRSLR